jgi:hypothetical protein
LGVAADVVLIEEQEPPGAADRLLKAASGISGESGVVAGTDFWVADSECSMEPVRRI